MRKLATVLLILLIIFTSLPVLAASEEPIPKDEQGKEMTLLKRFIDVGYFQVWKHSNGVWQDTDRDGTRDMPGQVKNFDFSTRSWLTEIPGAKAVRILYWQSLDSKWAQEYDKLGGYHNLSFDRFYNDILSTASSLGVEGSIDSEVRSQTCTLHYKNIRLSRNPGVSDINGAKDKAMNLKKSDSLAFLAELGIPLNIPSGGFSQMAEGWIYWVPYVVEIYGYGKTDVSVRSDKDVYTGAPGSTVNIIAAVKNEGAAPTITDFGVRWQSDDWSKKIFSKTNINLNPGDDPHYTVPVTVPTTEKKLVLRANIDGNTPPNEATLDNNTKVVTIKPAQVDLKVTITPVRNPVQIAWNSSYGKITANVQVTRKDSGEPVPARLTISGPGGSKTLDFSSTPGQAYKNYYTFDRAAPGTYTITAEAWPINMQDANPADNKASCQIQVTRKPAPTNDVPKEPDIHGELGGM